MPGLRLPLISVIMPTSPEQQVAQGAQENEHPHKHLAHGEAKREHRDQSSQRNLASSRAM